MKAVCLPSGEGTSTRICPRPRRPVPGEADPEPVAAPMSVHFTPAVSQVHRRPLVSKETDFRSGDGSMAWKGRARAVNEPLAAGDDLAASPAGSKARFRLPADGA